MLRSILAVLVLSFGNRFPDPVTLYPADPYQTIWTQSVQEQDDSGKLTMTWKFYQQNQSFVSITREYDSDTDVSDQEVEDVIDEAETAVRTWLLGGESMRIGVGQGWGPLKQRINR